MSRWPKGSREMGKASCDHSCYQLATYLLVGLFMKVSSVPEFCLLFPYVTFFWCEWGKSVFTLAPSPLPFSNTCYTDKLYILVKLSIHHRNLESWVLESTVFPCLRQKCVYVKCPLKPDPGSGWVLVCITGIRETQLKRKTIMALRKLEAETISNSLLFFILCH